ncbi:hypothetical protein PPYR_10967 [Photinus pyralis]|uniref:Uncharacterized protein n=1 Tax=Photinus pyralis TaxID=7054 RepID=A0A5N4AI02_PHOPY|nr:protein MLP1-like isoform X1 [Photinus pyralis]KAB0796906.1 hypothetical protein PPYR_10967 [Photinus pyralis]
MADDRNMDFNNSLILHNQNLEEAEELEDRKRREEEMHSLISQALAQFDFDDQSTINSSIRSNDETGVGRQDVDSLHDMYREANANEQLKVLYDIRVREVETLNKEMEKLKLEWKEQEKGLKRQIMLHEAENQRKSGTLKESQSLVVEKVDQIQKLTVELNSFKNALANLESKLKELDDENSVLRQLNMDLEQQRILMQNGFPLKSAAADKEFQETQRVKIDQLEKTLFQAKEEIAHKERRCRELEEEFKRNLCNRDSDLMQKNVVISTLTENNQRLLQQYQEILRVTNEQTEKLQLTNNQHLERELQKIREKDALEKEIRREVTGQFETEVSLLKAENEKLKHDLCVNENQLSNVQNQIEALSGLSLEKQELENNVRKLLASLSEMKAEKDGLVKTLKVCEDEKQQLENQQARFIAESQLVKVLKTENENLQKKITDLQVSHREDERSVQTSLPFINNLDYTNSQEQLLTARNRILVLENQMKQLQEENSQLQVKIGLEHERESLIKNLQQKATEFEKIIQKRQKHHKTVSIGTNTTHEYDSSLLKVQHDTLLYQTEAKLHQKLKKEFDEKLSKAISDHNTLHECKNCKRLQEECEQLNDLRQHDREAVVNLFTVWEEKFDQLEREHESSKQQLMNARAEAEQIALYSKQTLAEYTEKYGNALRVLQDNGGGGDDGSNDLIKAKVEAEYKDKYHKTMEEIKKNMEGALNDQRQANIQRCQIISKRLSQVKAKIYEDIDRMQPIHQILRYTSEIKKT